MRTLLMIVVMSSAALGLTVDEAKVRLEKASNIAKLQNDPRKLEEVEAAGKQAKRALVGGDEVAAEKAVQAGEVAAGLDAGGKTMNGIRIYSPAPEMLRKQRELGAALKQAMAAEDVAAVKRIVEQSAETLGEELGKPENALPGRRAKAMHPVSEAENANIFVAVLASGKKYLDAVSEGRALPNVMARFYGDIVHDLCVARPMVEKFEPAALERIDAAVKGAAAVMLKIQCEPGHFPFPDLRAVNIRWRPMIQKLVDQDPAAVRDGWLVTVDADGGSQFDTGVCGEALLRAGKLYGKPEWTSAGLRAADWAVEQPVCANFNYNAFSVMLLARAYEVSGEKKYLDAAIRKWRVGLQPGQVSSGRWVDPHNAKTVYHLIILRGLHELLAVLPAEAAERAELMAQCVRAVKPVVEEIEAMGVTNSSMLLGQLVRHAELCGASNASLARAAEQVASLAFERSVEEREGSFSGKQTAVTPGELAVMWRVWGTRGASPAGK